MNSAERIAQKNKTLVVVEGDLEKEQLIERILMLFPELPLKKENIIIYGTNIYNLHRNIVEEYGTDCFANNDSINIPWIVSKIKKIEPKLEKNQFTNIILVFDYERQDTNFDPNIIQEMQNHFQNIEEDGQLYLNYPMIEAYLDMKIIPDSSYMCKRIAAGFRTGNAYKVGVNSYSELKRYFSLYDNVQKALKHVPNLYRKDTADKILCISSNDKLSTKIEEILRLRISDEDNITFTTYKLLALLGQFDYLEKDIDYWMSVRQKLLTVMVQNIQKALLVQNPNYKYINPVTKDEYWEIDAQKIVDKQNKFSADKENGFIWILSMFMTFMGQYKFFWKLVNEHEMIIYNNDIQ